MARFKPVTAKTVSKILHKLANFIEEEGKESREAWAKSVDSLMDNALWDDAFGTEGQLDPRGDHRD